MGTRFLSTLLLLILFSFSALNAQTDSARFFDEDNDFRITAGISGGFSLVNPSQVNDQIAFLNNSLEAGMEKITSMQQIEAFVRIRPIMAPYLLMRVGAITVSRSFDYLAAGRSAANTATGNFNISDNTRWTVYPLVIGMGTTIPKTPVEVEVGIIYALGYITDEESSVEGGSFTNTSSGSGWGLEGRVSPHFKVSKNVNLLFEISYRVLSVRDYSDEYGNQLKDFEFYLNGISTCVGMTYTFD
ncbi:MAG: hypothetical protein WBZ48_02795 [Bacteroidota bacterium]